MKKLFIFGFTLLILAIILLSGCPTQEVDTGQTTQPVQNTPSQQVKEASEEISEITENLVECAQSAMKVTGCTYLPEENKIRIRVENIGARDISDFLVNIEYGDGTSTEAELEYTLYAAGFGALTTEATAQPAKVKVQSVQCSGIRDTTTKCFVGE